MAKYHITADGKPGVCHAEKGMCPFGGADQHFPSAEQAQAVADERAMNDFSNGEIKQSDGSQNFDRAKSEERKDEIIEKYEFGGGFNDDTIGELQELYNIQSKLSDKENFDEKLHSTFNREYMSHAFDPDEDGPDDIDWEGSEGRRLEVYGSMINANNEKPNTGFVADVEGGKYEEKADASTMTEDKAKDYMKRVIADNPKFANDPNVYMRMYYDYDTNEAVFNVCKNYTDVNEMTKDLKATNSIRFLDMQLSNTLEYYGDKEVPGWVF